MRAPDLTAAEIFERYEEVRPRLPAATFPASARKIANLSDIAGEIDVFLLDAFGVLNVGETAIPGAVERIRDLETMGKKVFVVTNAASYRAGAAVEKYRSFGFGFLPEQVISSRDAMLNGLEAYPDNFLWGVAALETAGIEEIPANVQLLGRDAALYDAVDGFILLSAADWDDARQDMLLTAIEKRPRPVVVGNPDLVAPREWGLSREPGFFAHAIADAVGVEPDFYGKPYLPVFERALLRPDIAAIPRARIAMVGDTLHTDILGGAAAGLKTVLVAGHGLLKGEDIPALIEKSGIVPDFIAETT
ncbi:MAG: TIGR01459 family HAD-type hydrolase [Alphaproteobacteria bacterium]|nr:MAG: TIGR01459 family HAD-type hydrolase [Alphaproteobacteria bacterium]